MASTSTPSANEQAKEVIIVHTVQLKPMLKAQSGRMTSSGISDVVIALVYFEKTHLKKMIMIIIIIIKRKCRDG